MWNTVINQIDIDDLLAEYYGFHDSCICSVDYISGAKIDEKGYMGGIDRECTLIIRFESQMPEFHKQPDKKILLLKFIGLRRLSLVGYLDNYFCANISCYLSFYKEFIIWSDDDGFDPENYRDTVMFEEPMPTFVVANRLEWRFA